MPRKPSQTFTEKEIEIMKVIWELGEATVKQIQEQLPASRHYQAAIAAGRHFSD